VVAHIGNVPIEEWLPFLVPVLLLYLYGRARSRRRRMALARLPKPTEPLRRETVGLVLARWAAANHSEVAAEQLPLLYPPGPDGVTAVELARRIGSDTGGVTRRLDDLADLGYVEIDEGNETRDARAWLTVEGFDLVRITEEALLASHDAARTGRWGAGASSA
jgi:hypothetical protein